MSRLASRLPAWPFVLLVLAIALLSLFAPYTWRGRLSEPVDIPPVQDAAHSPHAVYANASDPATGAASPLPEQATLEPAAASRILAEAAPLTFVVTPVPDPDAAPSESMPSDAAPSDAAPSDAAPSDAAPSESMRSDAAPSDAAPSDAAPSDAAQAEAAPADALPSESRPPAAAQADAALPEAALPEAALPEAALPEAASAHANNLRAVKPNASGRPDGETSLTDSAPTPRSADAAANTPAGREPVVTDLAAPEPAATAPQGTSPAATATATPGLATPTSEPSSGESGPKIVAGPTSSGGDVSKPTSTEPAGEKLAEVVDETRGDVPAVRGNEPPRKITDSAGTDSGSSAAPV